MKYFFLAYGEMSLRCLNDLIMMKYPPAFVVTHRTYDYENQKHKFYEKIDNLCGANGIELIKTDSISEIKERFIGFDAGICAGFMEIIKEDVFNVPEHGILNIHCGKLPEYRGRAPISRAIMDGNDTLYLTIHKIDSGVDSGDILFEKSVIIDDEDDVNTLYYKCSFNCANLLIEVFEKLITGKKDIFRKQDLAIKEKANRMITDSEREIDWNESVKTVYNKIRALAHPYPTAFTAFSGKKFLILRSKPYPAGDSGEKPGVIADVNEDYIIVRCKDGYIMNYDVRDENLEEINYKETFKKGDSFN